ncbi:unnamed protein product, partial [Coregonus sp. 'balchen']
MELLLSIATLSPVTQRLQAGSSTGDMRKQGPQACVASIVQRRIIYFQDEGSLTVRLCEKALIGASHSRSYVLWEYGGFASEGVKQVAELGSPVKMEEEIRQK